MARGSCPRSSAEAPEGSPRPRVVVIEFASHTLECCRSAEPAEAMALRDGRSPMDLAIVEGYVGPLPSGD